MAGLACATRLARLGHNVTILERFEEPAAVGAGILIQPTGIAALQDLDLARELVRRGDRVEQLIGTTTRGRRIMNIRYADLHPELYAIGIHRGTLFALLLEAAEKEGVEIRCGAEVSRIEQDAVSATAFLEGEINCAFDAIILASGSHSQLRQSLAIRQRAMPYPWGALWTILDTVHDDPIEGLQQVYEGSHTMIGLLPSGLHPEDHRQCVSFFWSLPCAEYESWHERDFDEWKRNVVRQWPRLSAWLEPLKTHDDLAFAQYGDVIMSQWHDGRVVCIGDAAHAMSPQLGQGTNLALIDAGVLADCMHQMEITEAFAAYSSLRRRHLRYYQRASRWLTPFFQSRSRVAAGLRDSLLPAARILGFTRREATRVTAGLKTGMIFDPNVVPLLDLLDKTRVHAG